MQVEQILRFYTKCTEFIFQHAVYSDTHIRKPQHEEHWVNFEMKQESNPLKLQKSL